MKNKSHLNYYSMVSFLTLITSFMFYFHNTLHVYVLIPGCVKFKFFKKFTAATTMAASDNDIVISLKQLLFSSNLQSTELSQVISQLESIVQHPLNENEKLIIKNKMKELAGGKYEPFASLILPHLLLGILYTIDLYLFNFFLNIF